eukprot:596029-Rhodomonas_salina.3
MRLRHGVRYRHSPGHSPLRATPCSKQPDTNSGKPKEYTLLAQTVPRLCNGLLAFDFAAHIRATGPSSTFETRTPSPSYCPGTTRNHAHQ